MSRPSPTRPQPGQVFTPGREPAAELQPGFNPSPPGVAANPADPNAPKVQDVKQLLFDVAAKPWSGNLGVYLREQLKPGDTRVKVRVSGTGKFYFTPVRIPDGISLEILVLVLRQRAWAECPRVEYSGKGRPAEQHLIDVKQKGRPGA